MPQENGDPGHDTQVDKTNNIEMSDASDVERQQPSESAPEKGPAPPDNPLYQPRTLKFWLVLLCNFMALFLVALDRTIISTAIPRITDEFKSLGDIGWYGSAYMLTTSASQLVFGRIYRIYDMKMTFLISIIIFEVGSVICGAAPNSTAFIVGRAIAGLASAGIFSGAMQIMIPMVPLHKRPMFQGLFGMVFGIASVMGPLIGGGFTSGISWRWCFYINLPIGAVSWVFMLFFWNPPKEKKESMLLKDHVKNLDPLGIFFLIPSVVCLLLALQWGGATYPWNDGRIIALFVLFGVLAAGFVLVQVFISETATVPPKVIKQRSVFFGACFTFLLAGSMLMMVYFVPVWFQTVKGVNPVKSGIYTLPLVLSLVVASIISGGITQKLGYYVPAMLASPSIMAVGQGLMSTWNTDSPASHWIAYQFLAGFGLGFGMQTAGLAVQAVLPREDISTGIAVIFFTQQLGGAVFTSVGQTILNNLLVAKLDGIPGLNPSAIVNQGATDLLGVVPEGDVGLVISAYNYACTRIFLGSMGLAFAALISVLGMEWKNIKKGKNGPDGPGVPGTPGSPTDKSEGEANKEKPANAPES